MTGSGGNTERRYHSREDHSHFRLHTICLFAFTVLSVVHNGSEDVTPIGFNLLADPGRNVWARSVNAAAQ